MSSTTGFSPAASARPWRSCTRSLRDAAISTSTSPTEVGARADDAEVEADLVERERDVLVGLGLDLQFELFFAQAGGQHDLLGDHRRLRHRHHDVLGLGCRSSATTRRTASATSSNFSIWPSVIQPFSNGSEAKRSSTNSPPVVCPKLDQLDARRTDVQTDHRADACDPAAGQESSRIGSPNTHDKSATHLLISHFNASSKALVHQRKIPAPTGCLVAIDRRVAISLRPAQAAVGHGNPEAGS